MNRWIGIGRITKDLELRKTTNGKNFMNFSIAIDRPYSNAQGQKETDFINCVAWNKTAENMATYVGKGSLIGIDGRIQTRNYENNEGKRVYITEIMAEYVQFLDSKGSTGTTQNNQNQLNDNFFSEISKKETSENDLLSELDVTEEELPF